MSTFLLLAHHSTSTLRPSIRFPIIKLGREEYLKTVRGFTFRWVGCGLVWSGLGCFPACLDSVQCCAPVWLDNSMQLCVLCAVAPCDVCAACQTDCGTARSSPQAAAALAI